MFEDALLAGVGDGVAEPDPAGRDRAVVSISSLGRILSGQGWSLELRDFLPRHEAAGGRGF